ncbi:unnamed protein product [Phyllotreta striolata]|uniref:UDP-glucuronosyltransferase n=1 Tax=Phyllotreta striolata TaxID=444603 RepID=A0A9N9XNK0_PHYSR|nr:unnamed protein product [Phyllotreta striolata]
MFYLKILKLVFSILILSSYGECYKYLGVFPIPIKSHMMVFSGVLRELARKGHEVTVVSVFPEENAPDNYRNIDLSGYLPKLIEFVNISTSTKESRFTKYTESMKLFGMADIMCEALASRPYQKLLKENGTFDAIITEIFNSDCYLSIADKFDAPIIGFSSSRLPPWMFNRFAMPTNPSYIPVVLTDYTDKMTFLQRVDNTLLLGFSNIFFAYYRQTMDKKVISKYVGSEAADLDRMIEKVVLLLVNTHFTLNLPVPLGPNTIEVGGVHLEKPKLLFGILKKWVDESPHGVIYFSMGSFNKGSTFPKEKMKAFIEAFELLPQRVIWKWESETMEGKTDKILPYKWIPQLDLLCDPNVKLFISHAGLLGITEAVHCGVPLVLIPQFGDQHNNAKCMESTGAAVILPISKITKETAYEALSKALNLSDNMKELSNRFNDRPMSPLDTAVYWSEYVVRHKGAYFMKSAAIDLPFYQYYLLDVLLFIVSILLLVTYVSYRFLKCVLGLTGNQNSKRKKD